MLMTFFFNRSSPGELYLAPSRAIKWNGATAWSNLVVRLISHRRCSVRNACISLAPSFFPLRPTVPAIVDRFNPVRSFLLHDTSRWDISFRSNIITLPNEPDAFFFFQIQINYRKQLMLDIGFIRILRNLNAVTKWLIREQYYILLKINR